MWLRKNRSTNNMLGRSMKEVWAYFRRSTGKQEASLPQQHAWVVAKARELGLSFTATLSDLEYMLANGLHAHKGMFLDDGITGADLDRPGFVQIRRQAILGPGPSHILIYMPDRFARPDKAYQAMQAEVELLYADITVVFSGRVHSRVSPG
jgi:DNA invertase Pin-like site-specific DNA recombinase